MLRFLKDRWAPLAFGSAVVILLAVGAVAYRGLDAFGLSVRWIAHTHEVLENVRLLGDDMSKSQYADEHYAVTGDAAALDVSRADLTLADGYAAAIGAMTVDNPAQQRVMPDMAVSLAQRRQRIDQLRQVRIAQGGVAAAAMLENTANLSLNARATTTILQLRNEEWRLLVLRNDGAARIASQTKTVLVIGFALALIIAAAAGWFAQRSAARRRLAEAVIEQCNVELSRSNDDLGKFAYVASHDLQEPLRMVTSFLGLLSQRYRGKLDAEADEYIAFAVDGAARMRALIQDLLAYSMVGAEGAVLANTSSEAALDRAVVNLRGAIETSGALVTRGPLPEVLADPSQLTQLFQNLVGNAIKYQNPGVPVIDVTAVRGADKKWLFAVKDNGLGIEPQYFEKIFGMFQRLHGRGEFTGTGIGLAICKKIVERHGGSISVESQAGAGSTFRFALAGA